MHLPVTGFQRQVIISFCLYLGQILIAYSLSWTGPVLPKLRDLDQSPLPHLLTEAQLSLVATLLYLGAIPGSYMTVWLSNTKGRKPCLILAGLCMIASYVIKALSTNLAMLYISRLVVGIAAGVIGVTTVVYIGEIASTNIRGLLLSGLGIANTLGTILMFCTGPFVSYHITTIIPLLLSLLYVFCLCWIPDTPIYFMIKGNDKEITKVLRNLDRLEDRDELLKCSKEMIGTNARREWAQLFTVKCNRKALFIVTFINLMMHGSGVLGIIFFSATIFEMAGSSISSDISMIVIGCFQLAGSVLIPFFIERTGRKIVLIISSIMCSITMFTLGSYFYLDHIGSGVIENMKWLPLLLLVFFYISYGFGLGIVPTALIGEMFTSDVRSKGSTVTMTTSWMFGFAVNTAFGALLQTIGGHVAFWFFACTCACAALFTVFFIPETKGKTLTEIQESLS